MIDTQLFLRAAINRRSLPAHLIFERRGQYVLVVTPEIISEIANVLNRDELRAKFRTLTDQIVQDLLLLLTQAEEVNVSEVKAVSRDPKDDIFLACAQASAAQYIVSEDKDLLVLNPYEGISIINALDFLRVLQSLFPGHETPENN
ncbi:MAG: putative toxin-antitoxin system toxin component, PIN family [Anaerolineae bacterium]|nr:putative toxin-antitoxin system toxin component, PIN family [Anaerolineae bacterium]